MITLRVLEETAAWCGSAYSASSTIAALRQDVERIWAELESCVTGGLTPEQRTDAIKVLEQIEDSLAHATTQST